MGMLIYSVGALSLLLLCTAPASAVSVPAFELEKSDEAQRELVKIQKAGDRNKTTYKHVHILVEKGGSTLECDITQAWQLRELQC
ncbi:hypothetical protein JKP88DRAFT_216648, partial [Tribonema minus]